MIVFWAFLIVLSLYLVYSLFFNKTPPDVYPEVPIIDGKLPFIGCGMDFIRNPKEFLLSCRKRHGETFMLHLFGFRLLFTFSLEGLAALYQIREADASFTEATRALLQLKLPPEVTSGSMTMFHRGLRKPLLEKYLQHINSATVEKLSGLDQSGYFEIFTFMKQLVHKIGFICWVGKEAAQPKYLERFIADFERLDPENGFQDLASLTWTILTRKRGEYQAIEDMKNVLKEIWLERQKRGEQIEDNLTSLHEMYAHLPDAERYHKVAVNVFQFHLASQANMYAALSWTLINLLLHRDTCMEGVLREVQQGDGHTDDMEFLDQLTFIEDVAQESLRLAQQSITLRKVMKESPFGSYRVKKGCYLATLLSITNMGVPDGQQPPGQFWPFRKLDEASLGSQQYVVSTFGHGFHACPGKKFALLIVKAFLIHALSGKNKLTLEPQFKTVDIPPGSVGAVARASHPCLVKYTKN
eukprot:m.63062 g.63062  ORF g.63062 m.63062 type:complete len:469 (+) comp35137_c0_seq1:203-1609(+)